MQHFKDVLLNIIFYQMQLFSTFFWLRLFGFNLLAVNSDKSNIYCCLFICIYSDIEDKNYVSRLIYNRCGDTSIGCPRCSYIHYRFMLEWSMIEVVSLAWFASNYAAADCLITVDNLQASSKVITKDLLQAVCRVPACAASYLISIEAWRIKDKRAYANHCENELFVKFSLNWFLRANFHLCNFYLYAPCTFYYGIYK